MRRDGGWLAAAFCALAVCLGCEQEPSVERMGISGGAVSLRPKVATTNMTQFSWKKGRNLIADSDNWFAPGYESRVKLDADTGSMTLSELQLDDSGEYSAEVHVRGEIQCTFFSLQILEPPRPCQLNCTAVDDRIWVSCELDALYNTEKISKTYTWRYQKSNKQIPGDSSEIFLEKEVDLSENITCIVHVLDANTSSSIVLRECIPTGAALQRNKAWLVVPFVVVVLAGVAFYCWWKTGCHNCRRNGTTQKCEDGADAGGASPEEQCLREEGSGNFKENSCKGSSDPVT